jgi:hypothetical protein
MAYEDVDRRKHRRAYFSIGDNIIGNFILYRETETGFNAPILNLSSGGLHFTLSKNQGIFPLNGARLRLVKIEGEAALDFEFNSELEVKWILGHESLPHIGCGCEFIYMSKPGLDRISEFIDSKYVRKTVK